MIEMVKSKLYPIYIRLQYLRGRLLIRMDGKLKNRNETLKRLKNKYENQRCFILGNGPSLTAEDLNKLKNEVTFASNGIFKIFSKTDWRPTYYAIFDESVAERDGVAAGASSIECNIKFFREEGYKAYRKIKGNNCYLHSLWSRKYLDKPDFSLDIKKGVYTIATVTYTLMQIAVYMGFKEIYLLGCDNNYAITVKRDGSIVRDETVKSYFGEPTEAEQKVMAATWEMDVAFAYAEEFSRKNGFRIYNATRGGKLESFERVNFDKLFVNEE